MADTKHPGGAVAKYTIANSTRGGRFVNTPNGEQVAVPPKGQVTVELTEKEAQSAKARGDLTVTKVARTAPTTTDDTTATTTTTTDPTTTGDDADKAVSYVAHEKFGDYFGYNAEGQKVEGAGPWKKDAAQTWATENKVEFKGSGS